MKNQTICVPPFLIAIVTLMIAGGCASVSIPNANKVMQSIMVVAIESHNPQKVHAGIETYFELRVPGSEEVLYIKQNCSCAIGKNLGSGDFEKAFLTQKVFASQGGGWVSGAQENQAINLKTKYKLRPGHITIFPVKFVYRIKPQAGGVQFKWDMEAISEADRERILSDLRKQKHFSGWKIL